MAEYDYDLFTIGAGSGGVRASRFAAGFGARVAVAEDRYLGGTCVNVGCVPKKLMFHAAHFADDFEDARHGYGWSLPGEPRFDWATFRDNKDREIERLNGIYRNLLRTCDVYDGRATIVDPHTVEVLGKRYTSRYILVATGGWPFVPPEIPGLELAITSNEIFHLERQPERLLVAGGGYIAVEFAGVFHGLGSRVTQIYRGPLFLRGFDDDMRKGLAAAMRARGIDLRFDTTIRSVEKGASGLVAHFHDGTSLEADQILCAKGRLPLTKNLGLEAAGVKLGDFGAIVVDEYSKSSVDSIYAIGDVTDRIALTPVAIHEGVCLANTLFNDTPMSPDHADVPSAVFSHPPIGTVGLTEAQARERLDNVVIYRSEFTPLRQTISERKERTIMKLVVDGDSDRVVGLHILGPEAGEIVQGFAVAIKHGATKADFDATIGIHPTSAEELVTMREPVG